MSINIHCTGHKDVVQYEYSYVSRWASRWKAYGRCLDTGARTYEDRNLGVVYDVVADTTEERASNGVQTSRTHHDQMSFLCLGHTDDALAGVLAGGLTAHLVLRLPQRYTHTHNVAGIRKVDRGLHYNLQCETVTSNFSRTVRDTAKVTIDY